MNDSELRDAIGAAISRVVFEFRKCYPLERLAGLALVTDDNLVSLGHSICTESALRGLPEIVRFEPVDWEFECAEAALDKVRQTWSVWCTQENLSDSREGILRGYSLLVAAILQVRAAGLIDSDVFCTVISSAPNDLLESLENQAIRTLNTQTLADRREAALLRYRS